MENINVEETATLIQNMIEEQSPENEHEFANSKLDEFEIQQPEIRDAIISVLDI